MAAVAAAARRAFRPFVSAGERIVDPALSTSSLSPGRQTGFKVGGSSREFSSTVTPHLGTDNQKFLINAVNVDEIEKIRDEYEEAKRSFLNIPVDLKKMPKMDPEGIYVNRNIRLNDIQVYGFDYDYTLAHYSGNLQRLIYDLAKKHLVNELRYPESCLQFEYDPAFPIRGLYYDKLRGCLLKLDFFGSIEPDGCFFGRKKIGMEKINDMYGTRHIGRAQARVLVGLMDFFCFSEVCLIADIIQHFVDAKLEFDASNVYEDIGQAIQHVHRSGLLHKEILSDPTNYLVKNSQLFSLLKKLREKGKKLFLLTNSPYYFVDGGMQYMLEGNSSERNSWRELFDVVIAQASKPSFYTSDHPFRCYDPVNDTLAFTAVDKFLPDQIYYHGCLKSFLQITKWKGPEVIYFGDHLFSDLRGPSKAGWRTAAVIRELENEIKIQNGEGYRSQQAKFHIVEELLRNLYATVVSSERGQVYWELARELNVERRRCRSTMRSMFNDSFGATFLTDTGAIKFVDDAVTIGMLMLAGVEKLDQVCSGKSKVLFENNTDLMLNVYSTGSE